MEKSFTEKNTDVKTLTQHICNFLKEKDFEIMKGESEKGYQILAANSPYYRTRQVLDITIEGIPNSFTIRLEPAKKKKKPTRSIWLMQMLGGGFLLAEQWKSEEAWTKIEKDFWNYAENIIQSLGKPS